MKIAAASFIDDLFNNREPWWLTLLGTPGIGKTMLAQKIWSLFRAHRHGLINWPETERTKTEKNPYGQIVRWRGGYVNWGKCINDRMLKGDYDFIEDLCQYQFFVLDDIATEYERHRSLSASKLYQIFDSRLKKWTVITANVGLAEVSDALDPRLASRMLRGGGKVIDVETMDYALR